MKQFIHDMINMTEGQKLVNYWWLWLAIVVVLLGVRLYFDIITKRLTNKINRGDTNETKS